MLFGANAEDGDVIIRNNTTLVANDGAAVLVTAGGTNAEIDFLLSGNNMDNSNAAGDGRYRGLTAGRRLTPLS